MGLFKDIDKSKPNWREERSGIWNALCRAGARIGAIGKQVGPPVIDFGWQLLGKVIDSLIPEAIQHITDMVVKLTPKGIALIQGLIQDVDDLDLPGEEKYKKVFEEATAWVEDQGSSITKAELQTWIQDLFLRMRKNAEV